MGHIVKTPAGKWRANWREPSGRQRAKTFATQREAKTFLAEIQTASSQGTYVSPHAGRTLFRQHAQQWIETWNTEATTAARDRSIMANHVMPQWGGWPLGKIDHMSVQAWVTSLSRTHAPATVAECHRLTAAVIKSAIRNKLIAVNPCDGVRLPRRRKRDTSGAIISRDQLRAVLLPAVRPARYRTLVATAAGAGLRWGEVAGLCLDAVDLDAARLHVIRTVIEVSGHTSIKPYPKSSAGRRSIPLPGWLVAMMKEHLAEFPAPESGLIFTNQAGGPVRRTQFRARVWKPALVRAGLIADVSTLGLRFHDLRHSYATWLVDDGVPVNMVQRVLGHEHAVTTLDLYTRRTDDGDRILRALDDREDTR